LGPSSQVKVRLSSGAARRNQPRNPYSRHLMGPTAYGREKGGRSRLTRDPGSGRAVGRVKMMADSGKPGIVDHREAFRMRFSCPCRLQRPQDMESRHRSVPGRDGVGVSRGREWRERIDWETRRCREADFRRLRSWIGNQSRPIMTFPASILTG
jgi:hypothetical protein